MSLKIIDHPSPNFNERKDVAPSMIILHYTDMTTGAAALARLCDEKAEVSAHYLIEEDGRVFRLVHEHNRAWHAGESWWDGTRDINLHSIGIELVNPGHTHGYRPFPVQQMHALVALLRNIRTRYDIPDDRILGHSDVAPRRKIDPGELFDWPLLAARGLGVWPAPTAEDRQEATRCMMSEYRLRAALNDYGYDPYQDLPVVLAAFQRHFNPAVFKDSAQVGGADHETVTRLCALLRLKNVAKLEKHG